MSSDKISRSPSISGLMIQKNRNKSQRVRCPAACCGASDSGNEKETIRHEKDKQAPNLPMHDREE